MTDPNDKSPGLTKPLPEGETQLCPSPPFVTVEGVPNFRDLAGKDYTPREPIEAGPTASAKPQSHTIRPGYLYRGAQPTHITDNGRKTILSNLGIQDIYDLRSFKELRLISARYPDAPLEIPGVQRHHVPVYIDEDYTPISLAKKYDLGGKANAITGEKSQTQEGYIQAYEDILRQAANSGAYRTIMLHILNRPDRPLAFHCTAGKDRTGIFAALVLSLCGVTTEDIVTDYAYTTHGLGKWREHLIKRLMEGAGNDYRNKGDGYEATKPPTREEAENIIASHPEHMRGFLEKALEKEFGGARAYFKESCGFSDGELDRIVINLTRERS